MELAYVHEWVAFPNMQIEEMPVKLRVRMLAVLCKRAGLPFPLPRCMMCCKVRSIGPPAAPFSSSKTCWAHSNASCSRSTVWPLVRFLKPAFQPCHGPIPLSVFLVEKRGICVHPVLRVVAPPVRRMGPSAREPGQYAMPLMPTPSHHHPLLLLLLLPLILLNRR